MSPSFRFPPFPLATVEDLDPKTISVEPESDDDPNIFEPSTLEYCAHKHPSVNVHATPKVVPDVAQISREASGPQDLAEAPTDIPSSFNFPPFPLATVEKLAPQPGLADNTNAFELPVSEPLSQSSISILTQVARSLPEMLPEPESQSGSIFEDESHDDYVGISTSSIPPITSTQSLEMLVADKVYDEAERVLDALLEVGTPVPPSFAYEDAAIWAIRTPASTTADMDEQIKAFRKWFSLIPLGPSPRGPRPRRSPHEFARLRKRIMLSPLNSLRLIMEFGLIAAEKGYAHITHRHVISVVCMYGDPDVALQYIDELRDRNRKFLEQRAHATQVDALDNKLRVEIISVAIKTFAIAGRFDYAVQLIPDPTETHFHLRPASYSYLVHKMEMTRDRRYIPHIQFVTQHKSEARHRSVGLKKMKKPRLAQAVRCLANIGRFDLALSFLPKLLEAEVGLITDTLNFLLTRLRESGGNDHSEYVDRISQLRAAMESMPVTETVDSATPSPDMVEGPEEDVNVESATPSSDMLEGPEDDDVDYVRAIEALTKAWCLKEAVALMIAHRQSITKEQLYTLLLWKLRISYNPKYKSDVARIQELREQMLALRPQANGRLRKLNKVQTFAHEERREARPEDFSEEDILMASSISSSESPQRLGSSLAASLRTLRNGFRTRLVSSALPPNPLTVVGFLEAYFASGRTRAIILLRNLALSRGSHSASCSYIFAEMLFHARRGNPDLVIYTFVTHFFIVGLPRDDLLMRLQKMERDRASEALWTAAPQMKLFPHSMHAAVVWRALLDLARDERALEALYAKVLSFADKRSPQAPVLAAGIPLLNPPPVWKTGVDASAFTPFIRRMCRTFGTERGALILRDMVRLGIQPTIHQLTQLAIEYSRAGEVAKTFLVLDQVENATKAWETTKEANSGDHDEVARRRAVDPVFYRGIVRGFLFSNRIVEARNVERRMFKRYGYVPGEDSYVDELYEDLRAAEKGSTPQASISDAQSHKYAGAPPSAPGISREPASSAGG